MKNLLLSVAALAVLFAASCKKNDDATNSWTIGTTSYGAAAVTAVSNYVVASTNNGATSNTITLFFYGPTLPGKSGTYKIVDKPAAADELSFSTVTYNGAVAESYRSTDSGNFKAKVIVYDNKVTINIPASDAIYPATGAKANVVVNVTQTN